MKKKTVFIIKLVVYYKSMVCMEHLVFTWQKNKQLSFRAHTVDSIVKVHSVNDFKLINLLNGYQADDIKSKEQIFL